MKSKWFIGTLFFILALLGITRHQIEVPNQEILVQFADNKVTLDVTQTTIAIVKKQLQNIGADNIQVKELGLGRLKITYYSNINVTRIEKILSEAKNLGLVNTPFEEEHESEDLHLDQDLNGYKLDVSEIQNSYDLDSDFNGYIVELRLELENERIYNTVVNYAIVDIVAWGRNEIDKTAYILHRNIAITLDNSSHNIPDVRAGPYSKGTRV